MQTTLLDGKALSAKILLELSQTISENNLKPRLLIIQVGDHAASAQYVALKKKRGVEIGVEVIVEHVAGSKFATLKEKVSSIVAKDRTAVDGIMMQLPLPEPQHTADVLSIIPPELDVDGLLGKASNFNSAAADAVIALLSTLPDYSTKPFTILIIGDSPYVGGSIYQALLKTNTIHTNNIACINEFTADKEDYFQKYTVVISCVGKPHIYSAKALRKGAILIDVGTSPTIQGQIVGDFDTAEANGYLTAYTPVPGGVGPVTVAMLLKHVVENSLRNRGKDC